MHWTRRGRVGQDERRPSKIRPRQGFGMEERLTELQYHVTREAGTEPPNSGIHYMENRKGDYLCICCGHLLFTSQMKFDSRCGWPAFHTEDQNAGIKRIRDTSYGMLRIEVRCGSCDAHLGHVLMTDLLNSVARDTALTQQA